MKKAYIFAQIQVKDIDQYVQRYGLSLLALIGDYNGQILAAGPEFEVLEGESLGNWSVLAEFESYEDAKRFYDSDDYAPLRKLRTTTLTEQNFLTLMSAR